MSDESRHGKRPRGRRRRRLLIATPLALAIVVVVALLFLSSEFVDERLRSALESRLADAIDGRVEIGALDVDWFRLVLRFDDLRLEVDSTGDSPLTAEVGRGRLRLRWGGLFTLAAGRIQLASAELERPVVHLPRDFFDGERGAASREPRPFELRVGELHVGDGAFVLHDRSVPMEFRVSDVDLRGEWGAFRRAMQGQISFDAAFEQEPLVHPLQVAVAGVLRWQGSRVELTDATIEGDGLSAQLDLRADWIGGGALVGEGDVDVDLSRIKHLLRPSFPYIAGRVRGPLVFEQRTGPFRLEGDLEGEAVAFDDVRASRLRAWLHVVPGRLELRELRADAHGGEVRGSLALELQERDRLELQLVGKGLDFGELLGLVGRPLPLSASTDAQLSWAGEPDEPRTWQARGSFVASPIRGSGHPTAGRGTLEIVGGHARVVARSVRVAAAALELELELPLDANDAEESGLLRIAGTTRDAAATQRGTLDVLRAVGVAPPDVLQQPLTGRGDVSARIRLGPRTDLELQLDLREGSWIRYPYDEARVGLSLRGDRLTVDPIRILDGSRVIAGRVSLDLSGERIDALRIEADEVALPWLAAAGGLDPALIEGSLSCAVLLERGDQGLAGRGTVRADNVVLLGESLGSVSSPVEAVGDRLRLPELTLEGGVVRGRGALAWDLESLEGSLALELLEANLEQLHAVGGRLAGTLRLDGGLGFSPDGWDGVFEAAVTELEVAGRPLGDARGALRLGREDLQLRLDQVPDAGWRLQASLGSTPPYPHRVSFQFDGAELWLLPTAIGDAWARVSGTLVYEGAAEGSPSFSGTVHPAELHLGLRTLDAEEPISLNLEGNVLHATPLRFRTLEGTLEGRIAYDLESERLVDSSFVGRADLGVVTAVAPRLRATGPVRVELSAGSDGLLQGNAELEGGRVRLLGFPHTLEQLNARLIVDGDRFRIEGIEGLLGGGEIRGSGEGRLGEAFGFELRIDGNNVRVAYPDDFRAVYDGRLKLVGERRGLALSGEVEMLRGLYDRPMTWSEWLGVGVREVAPIDDEGLPDLQLDLNVRANGGVWARNDLMELETSLNLHVGGDLDRPELTGRMRLFEDGELRFRNVEYRIVTGTIDFVDPDRINPYLDLLAETEVGSYEIRLRVEGTADRFSYDLTSNPVLTQQDIIAVLATGKTLEELSARDSGDRKAFTGDLAANYFAGALTGRFERQLQQLLGLERVRIDPLVVGEDADPTARVTVGKEVADDLFLIYSTQIGDSERQLYQVEWKASRKFRLAAGREVTGGLGGEVQYSDRYWLGRRPKVPSERAGPALEPDAGGPRSKVGAVHLVGVEEEGERDLLGKLPLKPGSAFRRSEMLEGAEIIRRHFVRRGRIRVLVDAATEPRTEGGDLDVVYRISPGPRTEVRFTGTTRKDEKRIRRELERLWVESILGQDLIEDSAATIRDYYQDRGYYAADVFATTGDDGIVTFTVDRGPVVTIDTLLLEGVGSLDESRIRRQVLSRRGSIFARRSLVPSVLRADIAAIRALYRAEGFLRAEIDAPEIRLSTGGERATVVLRIREGPRFRVDAVEIPEGLPFAQAELRGWSGLAEGAVFSPGLLLEAESTLRSELDRRGYPEARVRGSYRLGEATVDIALDIDAGPPKRIESIEIRGNHLTREGVIRREIDAQPGDLLSRSAMLGIQHRLYRLGVFRNVRVEDRPVGEEKPGWYDVTIHVDEAQPLTLTFGAGYDTVGEWRGLFSIAHRNLGGRDQALGLQAKIGGIERRASLTYESPTIAGRRIPSLLSLAWQEREEVDFSQKRQSAALRLETRLSPKLTAFTRLNLQRVDLFDISNPQAVLDDKLENIQLGNVGYTLAYDSRDDPFSTKRGTYVALETTVFAEGLQSDASFVKWFLYGSRTRTFDNGQTLSGAVRLGLARPFGSTSRVPLPERFFAGGDSTLRGFPRDEVGPVTNGFRGGGEAVFLINQEWRFPIWGALRGLFFYDAGNVYETVGDLRPDDLRHVLGTGLRFETPIGPLRLEYGHKLDRRLGESRGELFLSIGSAF